jgi:Tfp pilus assembly protein PilE
MGARASVSHQPSRRSRRHLGLPYGSESLIVFCIVGALILIAVPTYLGIRNSANSAAARSNLRAAIPDVEAYYALTNSSYAGLSLHWLHDYDPNVQVDDPAANPEKQTATSYCVSATVGGKTWYKAGPAAPISATPC